MPDEIAEVIAVDFRCSGKVHASLIGVQRGVSPALVAQLIALAFNVTSAAEIGMVVTDDGKPDDFTDAVSNHDLAKVLSRITKRPVVYVDVPERIARQSMRQLGIPASLIEGLLQNRLEIDSRRAVDGLDRSDPQAVPEISRAVTRCSPNRSEATRVHRRFSAGMSEADYTRLIRGW